MLYDDMIENGGIKYKMLMNDMIQSRKHLNSSSTDIAIRDSKTDIKTKDPLEEIESLMLMIGAS